MKKPTEWEKIFANQISDMGLIFKILRNLYNSKENKQTKKKTNPQTILNKNGKRT